MQHTTAFADGVRAFDRGEYAKAIAIWTRLAEAGQAASAFNLGVLHEKGLGVPADLAQAAAWYRRAARAGDIRAHLSLARMYEAGAGVPQSVEDARTWYERAVAGRASDEAERQAQQVARERLRSMQPPQTEQVPYEGGRYLFAERAGGRCVIALQGRITRDATRQFAALVERASAKGCHTPFILLESGGGTVADGLELGREMRAAGYSTLVRGSCASACGLIFIGGRERVLVGQRARIGLHQPGTQDSQDPTAEKRCQPDRLAVVNRQIRSYLRFMLDEPGERVLDRSLATSCRSMDWLNPDEALRMGIATRLE